MGIVEENVRFEVEGNSLEGVLAYPETKHPAEAWLLLAPHPQMGGRMTNNVIQAIARIGAESGRATLRFNYRGVGGSGITLPDGVGLFDVWAALERERTYELLGPDVLGAHDFLRRCAPGAETVVVGYSLGAILAGMFCCELQPKAVVAIAPPIARVSLDSYGNCAVPKVFISGDKDFAFDKDRFLDEYARLPPPKTHILIGGQDHFFRGGEERLGHVVLNALRY